MFKKVFAKLVVTRPAPGRRHKHSVEYLVVNFKPKVNISICRQLQEVGLQNFKIFELSQTIHLRVVSCELALLRFNVYPDAVTAGLSKLYCIASDSSKRIHHINRFKS